MSQKPNQELEVCYICVSLHIVNNSAVIMDIKEKIVQKVGTKKTFIKRGMELFRKGG